MRIRLELLVASIALAACGDAGSNTSATATEGTGSTGDATATTEPPTTSATTAAPSCTPGEIVCLSDSQQSVCGDDGTPGPAESCSVGTCAPGLGCPECQVGETRCMGAEIQQCDETGKWAMLEVCNEAQGLTCDEATTACAGACLPSELAKGGLTATGCEFYAVTTAQLQTMGVQFAVVIENPGPTDATITISQDDGFEVVTDTVAAGTAKPIELPWVDQLISGFKGELAYGGAYRVQSDQPVRAIQYSPIDVTASVDSSLLWPRHTWGTSYFAASYTATPITVDGAIVWYRGFWTLVGGDAEAMVTVTSRPGTKAKGAPGIKQDGSGALKLNLGDVLQVVAGDDGDLTGAWIQTDKPVQVFGGHECGNVPQDQGFCDHMEEMMLPASQLGAEYVVVPPMRRTMMAERRAQVVRVIATDGATNLTYDPPQMGAPATIPGTGEFVELPPSAELYALTADKPVVVAQYMVGSTIDNDKSDPAMLVALPTSRFHTQHYAHTLADWVPLELDITAPVGATVTVDGMPVGGWVEVGGSGFQVAHVRINEDVGLIEVVGDQPIAVNAYSTRIALPATSFWHSTGGALAP